MKGGGSGAGGGGQSVTEGRRRTSSLVFRQVETRAVGPLGVLGVVNFRPEHFGVGGDRHTNLPYGSSKWSGLSQNPSSRHSTI